MANSYRLRAHSFAPFLICCFAASAQQPINDPLNTLDDRFRAAVAEYDMGKFADASTHLQALQSLAPESFELHELLGLSYAAQSKNADAVEQLEIAVRLKPDSPAARTNLATALVQTNKPQEAESQFRRALDLAPNDYTSNHNLAELYLRANKVADALPLLENAQRARSTAYNNNYDLALAYLLTDKLSQARQLTNNLVLQKDTGELHNLLGRIAEKEGDYLAAASEFATAAHMDPSEDNLFVWASELLLHRTYEPAIDVFERATERFPDSPRLFIGLGMALYSRGEYEKSIQSLLTASDLNPRDPRCYLFLSKAYLSSPNQAEAVIDRFRRFADLEPGNALAQYYYALSLWKGRRMQNPTVDYQTIESLLQRSVALDGTFADAHLQLGILYNEQHQYDKSLPEYERALQLNQNLPDVHYRLGQYYVHAGEKARAQNEFDLFKKLQAQHQAQVDKERAEVQQFVVSAKTAPAVNP